MKDMGERVVDVVVLGCGAAGMSAALAAKERGADVVIVEPQSPSTHTPNVRMSGGWVMMASDVDRASLYLSRCGGGLVEEDICRAWAERAVGLQQWLESIGVGMGTTDRGPEQPRLEGADSIHNGLAFTMLPADFPGRGGLTKVGGRVERGEAVYRGLRTAVRSANIEILWSTEPQSLVTEGSGPPTVTGVLVSGPQSGANHRISARRGVILATGGFGADEYLLNQFLGIPTRFYGNPGNRGGGLRLAMSVGADLVRMNRMVGRGVMSFSDTSGIRLGFMVDIPKGGYVIFDQLGRRYANEYEQAQLSHSFYYHMLQFDRENAAYVRSPSFYIFDERRRRAGPLAYRDIGPGAVGLYDWSADNQREIDSGWISKGMSASEAAIAAGYGRDGTSTIEATIMAYNDACKRGVDAFGRPPDSLIPLDTPPYYCVPLYVGGPYPHGGPRRDVEGRVMSILGPAVPGLFGAGEMGQAIGVLYPAAGAAISEAICLGRLAGETAAGS